MGHFSDARFHILIFRALQLGDLLCTVPSFRALRAHYPQARITLIGLPWASSFVQRFSSYLDDFIAFPGWPGLPESEPQIHRIPAFLQTVQQQQAHLALQMQGSGAITNPLVALLGARQAGGYYLPGQYHPEGPYFIPYPEGMHEIHTFIHLVGQLGAPNKGDHLEFPVSEAEQKAFETFRAHHQLRAGEYACLHPGARFTGRRLPVGKFATLGDALARKGYRVIITGSESERELTQAVTRQMRCPALDLGGQTGLGVLALLLGGARLLISNDTGVSHIAAALRTPSIILFTASEPNRWRPLDHQRHRAILDAANVPAEAILAEAEALLQEENSHAARSL